MEYCSGELKSDLIDKGSMVGFPYRAKGLHGICGLTWEKPVHGTVSGELRACGILKSRAEEQVQGRLQGKVQRPPLHNTTKYIKGF